jgi:hypothetical protein
MREGTSPGNKKSVKEEDLKTRKKELQMAKAIPHKAERGSIGTQDMV